jgi:hypothetical protein
MSAIGENFIQAFYFEIPNVRDNLKYMNTNRKTVLIWDLKEIVGESMGCIHLVQDRDQ